MFPSISSEDSTKEIFRNSLFWGFFFSSTLGLLVIIIYDCTIIHEVSNISYWWLIFPFPVPLFCIVITDVFGIIISIRVLNQPAGKHFTIAFIIITLFFQMMSYHSGWVILLLIIYPLQVGTVILMMVTDYIALAFGCASIVHYYKKRRNQELSLSIFMIGSYFFITLAYFLIVYYLFLAKYPQEDSITKFIPSFLPFVVIGICSWIAQNIIFKVIDYDKENQVGHSNNEDPQNNNNNEDPQNNNNNEDPHEREMVNLIEDKNENTPLLSGNQSTATRRTNFSINSNA